MDEDTTAGIGHNQPPERIEEVLPVGVTPENFDPASLLDTDRYLAQVRGATLPLTRDAAVLLGADKRVGTIDRANLTRAQDHVADMKRLQRRFEKVRKLWKGATLELGRRVDALFVDLRQLLDDAVKDDEKAIGKVIDQINAESREAARKQQAEEEERQRKRREAEAGVDQAVGSAHNARTQEERQAADDALAAALAGLANTAPVKTAAPVVERPRGETGATYVERTSWDFEITDPLLVPRRYCSPDPAKIKAAVQAADGDIQIAGVTVTQVKSGHIRGGSHR